jgi:LPXTG-motif cell wall-anchored protein
MKMKKILKIALIYMMIMVIAITISPSLRGTKAYASDLELVGNDKGLAILPEDTNLFDIETMNPGQTVSSKLIIKNNYRAPFELFMKAERTSEEPLPEQPDLYKQLQLKVTLRNEDLFNGSMFDFANSKDGISLGEFSSKELHELVAAVHMPGLETGNEFQDKMLETKWVFTAVSPGVNDLPKTGSETKVFAFSVLGLILIGFGAYKFKSCEN